MDYLVPSSLHETRSCMRSPEHRSVWENGLSFKPQEGTEDLKGETKEKGYRICLSSQIHSSWSPIQPRTPAACAHGDEFSRVGGGLNVCPRLLYTEGVLRTLFGNGATNDSSPLSAPWVLRLCTCPVDLGARSLIFSGCSSLGKSHWSFVVPFSHTFLFKKQMAGNLEYPSISLCLPGTYFSN